MMFYLHTKFHDNWISSFRGVAMTRFWDGRTDGRTDRQTDGRSDCTPRPAFAFGDAGKNISVVFPFHAIFFTFILKWGFSQWKTKYLKTFAYNFAKSLDAIKRICNLKHFIYSIVIQEQLLSVAHHKISLINFYSTIYEHVQVQK